MERLEIYRTTALSGLIPRSNLTNEEWVRIIEARTYQIRTHADRFMLPTLGDRLGPGPRGLHYALDQRHISQFAGTMGDVLPKKMKTRGVFGILDDREAREAMKNLPTGETADIRRSLWGMTADGQWVIMSLRRMVTVTKPLTITSRPVSLTVAESSLAAIVSVADHPFGIWHDMGSVIDHWMTHAGERFDLARRLHLEAQAENTAVSLRLGL